RLIEAERLELLARRGATQIGIEQPGKLQEFFGLVGPTDLQQRGDASSPGAEPPLPATLAPGFDGLPKREGPLVVRGARASSEDRCELLLQVAIAGMRGGKRFIQPERLVALPRGGECCGATAIGGELPSLRLLARHFEGGQQELARGDAVGGSALAQAGNK